MRDGGFPHFLWQVAQEEASLSESGARFHATSEWVLKRLLAHRRARPKLEARLTALVRTMRRHLANLPRGPAEESRECGRNVKRAGRRVSTKAPPLDSIPRPPTPLVEASYVPGDARRPSLGSDAGGDAGDGAGLDSSGAGGGEGKGEVEGASRQDARKERAGLWEAAEQFRLAALESSVWTTKLQVGCAICTEDEHRVYAVAALTGLRLILQ